MDRPFTEASASKTHNIQNRQISMPPGGIRTRNPSKRAATAYAIDRTATKIVFINKKFDVRQTGQLRVLLTLIRQ